MKDMLIQYYLNTEEKKVQLEEEIGRLQQELESTEKELDSVRPVMKAWKVIND